MGPRALFAGMHWKRSQCVAGDLPPFPDLRVRRVAEIVSSGGQIDVDVRAGGQHITPARWHKILAQVRPKAIPSNQTQHAGLQGVAGCRRKRAMIWWFAGGRGR